MKKLNVKKLLFYILILIIIISFIILLINKPKTNNKKENTKKEEKVNDPNYLWRQEKYYIDKNLERYINYYNMHNDLSYTEVVTRVNSNLDYTFYEDSNEADISKGMYTLVNKYFYLDKNYVPDNLVQIGNIQLVQNAYDNFVKLQEGAKKDGYTIIATSTYRNYNYQTTLYNNYVARDGKEAADTYSARPGYSEHQLGYSTDVTNGNYVDFGEFEYTEEYKWLQDNAYKYGFILRYPEGKEYITGYQYEPWHYRYVGVDIAKYIHENNITYEEYYEYFIR